MNKYKLGYNECVQECLKYVNGSSTNGANGIDQATRQRLLANLMRQYQSVNSQMAVNGAVQQPFDTFLQQANKLKYEQQQQQQLNKIVSPIGLLSLATQTSLSTGNLTSSPNGINSNMEQSNFRRSSVSPISSSSCSSSSSSSSSSSNYAVNKSSSTCLNEQNNENLLVKLEPNSDNLMCVSPSSKLLLENSSSSSSSGSTNDDSNVWRPW